ncbi:MAG: tetratricopeptide repeat protein [Candidatus Thorarchaeota archaeon]
MGQNDEPTTSAPRITGIVRTRTTAYEDDLRRRLSAFPRDAQSWYSLGRHLRSLSRFEEAEAALRKAISINPRPPHFWLELEGTLVALGKRDVEPARPKSRDSVADSLDSLRRIERRGLRDGGDVSPCISCKDYTYYGCSRGQVCEAILKWRSEMASGHE